MWRFPLRHTPRSAFACNTNVILGNVRDTLYTVHVIRMQNDIRDFIIPTAPYAVVANCLRRVSERMTEKQNKKSRWN